MFRADVHYGGRGEAAQSKVDKVEGGVHRPDGRPGPALPQEDRWEPARQHGVRAPGPAREDEGLGVDVDCGQLILEVVVEKIHFSHMMNTASS